MAASRTSTRAVVTAPAETFEPGAREQALPGAVGVAAPQRWQATFVRGLLAGDLAVVVAGVGGALGVVAARHDLHGPDGAMDAALAGILLVGWPLAIAAARAYELRFLATGAEEFKRIGTATLALTATVGAGAFLIGAPVSRVFVGLALPVTGLVLLLVRYLQRVGLHRRRGRGEWVHQVLAVGTVEEVAHLVVQSRLEPSAGFTVVGACVVPRPPGERPARGVPLGVPRVGDPRDAAVVARDVGADTIAVLHSDAVGPGGLRRLAWQLEGTATQLLLSPKLTDVAGPRVTVRPLVGLPLLHVDRPALSGFQGAVKTTLDRVLGTALLLVTAPLLLALALAVRLDSPGPVVFRQTRVGAGGRTFTCWKLRTMVADAESRQSALDAANESDGVLFKIRADPRVTRVGRFLRRTSLDELPQLANVVRGDMSLVGPRPPLPTEVSRYARDVRRRLLVKPGMTGLWQVSGRSELSWDESVRLDLYYVENWSAMLDLSILAKTVVAVCKGSGAF